MATDKRKTLVDLLLRSPYPLSGEELASRLQVSSRSVRTYVKQLNARGSVVVATHHGYELDRDGLSRWQEQEQRRSRHDTPDRRLRFLCRRLAQAPGPVSVYDLAEELCVSDSTVEADLGRVREVVREFDLIVRRDHEFLRLEGPERARRRLVRQMMSNNARGFVPATWQAFGDEFVGVDVPALREAVSAVIADSPLELNEFALSDVLLHLIVTVDRVRRGHVLPVVGWPPTERDAAIADVCDRLADAAARISDVVLPESERDGLYGVLAVRCVRSIGAWSAEAVVDPAMSILVGEILDDTSGKYLLGPADPTTLLNLSLHVQNVVARARSNVPLTQPLGETLKNSHPLMHDLAVDFAGRLEQRLDITVAEAEIDYLALHLGMQYLRYLQQRDLVTITLVVPRYYGVEAEAKRSLARSLKGQAIIETVVTKTDVDFGAITSDLIVSAIEPAGPVAAPVVLLSPLVTRQDLDRVAAAVRVERDRNIRRRIRTTLSTLIDPTLFVHVEAAASKEAALQLLTDRLLAAGYTEPHFYDDVLDRENRSATAFGGEFAIPHSMHMDAHATAVAVLVSDKGIPWGNSLVRLVFLFALSPEGRQVFRDVLDEITSLLSEGTHLAELIAAGGNAESFVTALMELLER